MATDRRRFLQQAGAGALAAGLSSTISRALAIPAHHRTGTIADVEHIVFLMQENRSFDHYFGTLRGVRGFGDPRAVALALGRPGLVPAGRHGGYVTALSPAGAHGNLGLQPSSRTCRTAGATRTRPGTAASTTSGCRAKGTTTMAYLTRAGHPVPLRAGRRVHRLRRLPLLVAGADRPEPLSHVDGLGRQRRQGRRPGARQRRGRLRLVDLSRASDRRPASLEGLPGHRRRAGRGALLGMGRRCVHRQLRRQLAAVLPPVPERRCPAARCSQGARSGTNVSQSGQRCSTSSARTCWPTSCRRCRGSWRPRRTASTPTGRPTTAPGTSRSFWTR